MADTYHHFEFPAKTMASVYRALRKGGQLIVIDYHRKEGETDEWILDHIRADRGTVIREIQAAGFGVVGEAGFLEENYFCASSKSSQKRVPGTELTSTSKLFSCHSTPLNTLFSPKV